MARQSARRPPAALDRGSAIPCAQAYVGRDGAAALERRVAVRLDDAERVEAAGDRRRRVERRGAPRRRARASSGSRIRSGGGILPSMNRVTSQPSGSTKSTTSGPIPSAAAARVAASSTPRSIPRRSVSLPATRSTSTSSPSTVDLEVVVRDAAAEHLERARRRPGQTRSTAASSSLTRGSARPPGRRAARRRPRRRPTRRRSRPRPPCRRRARPAGTRTRSTLPTV